MKPAPFSYAAPTTTREIVHLLDQGGEGAKILAGGQSLVPLMNMRLARPDLVVDINQVGELDYLREEGGWLAIGALARQRALETSPLIEKRAALLREAATYIGHFQLRNRGTVCGSLAHADPAAELPAVMSVLGAELRVLGVGGERAIAADDFFVSYLTTALAPGELLQEARVPFIPSDAGWSIYEVSRRHGDFALVGCAVLLLPGADGTIEEGRIALFGVGSTPVRPRRAEQLLAGAVPSEALLRAAAALVPEEIEPDGDLHASAEYRSEVAEVVARRALLAAARRLGRKDRA